MRLVKILLLFPLFLLSTLGLNACALLNKTPFKNTFKSGEEYQYQTSTSLPELHVPNKYDKSNLGDDYAIPNLPSSDKNYPVSTEPPGSHLRSHNQQIAGMLGSKPTGHVIKVSEIKALPVSALQVRLNKNHYPIMYIKLDHPSAWTALGSALQKSRYPIIWIDKKQSIYFVLDPSRTAGKLTKQTPIYQFRMVSLNTGEQQVTLLDNKGNPLIKRYAEHIINILVEGLIGHKQKSLFQWLESLKW